MKILIISSTHPFKNAGIVAYDLYKGLKSIDDNDVKILTKVWDKYSNKDIIPVNSSITEKILKGKFLFRILAKKLLKILFNISLKEKQKTITNPDFEFQNEDQTATFFETKKLLKRIGFKPDVIIVLFMPSFLSFKNLYELNNLTKAKILLYMMDMAPITGGCHYAWSCKGYQNKCGNCPALFSENINDQSRINWEFKKKYVDKTDITIIAGSEWQFKQLNLSSLYFNKAKYKILLGINTSVFNQEKNAEARNIFKIPTDKKIIFFGGVWYEKNRYKGFKELLEAMAILKKTITDPSSIHIIIAGNGNKELNEILEFNYTYVGYLNHKDLSAAFQSADVFVSPSIEDSGPMMVNQSIMTGTPVVAFEMGVAMDLVITGKTGYLAKLGDSSDLAKGVKYILSLNKEEYRVMSQNCVYLGLSKCSIETQIEQLNIIL